MLSFNHRPIPIKEIQNPLICMAPMVGLSHVALRMMARRYLPANYQTIWPTEMLSSRRLPYQHLGKTPETAIDLSENNLVPQILGNEERFIAPSTKKLQEWGAVGIDINMGCPVQKALRHNYGVSLMGDSTYAAKVVSMTVKNTSLPVSVKLRAGLEKNADKLLTFTRELQNAGASWIVLHPRLASEKRRGEADWELVKYLRDNLLIPVIGNGDIQTVEDGIKMLQKYSPDGIMIGRALTAKPWLMASVLKKLGHNLDWPVPLPENAKEEAIEFGRSILYFIQICEQFFTNDQTLKRLKFFLQVAHPWLNYGHALAKGVGKHQELTAIKNYIALFFENTDLILFDKTDLRY